MKVKYIVIIIGILVCLLGLSYIITETIAMTHYKQNNQTFEVVKINNRFLQKYYIAFNNRGDDYLQAGERETRYLKSNFNFFWRVKEEKNIPEQIAKINESTQFKILDLYTDKDSEGYKNKNENENENENEN